jgi:hypothetical protein
MTGSEPVVARFKACYSLLARDSVNYACLGTLDKAFSVN